MAIHVLDEANRCLNCKVPQCQKGCPIHTPIPTVIQLMLHGKLDEAGWMLFENNPLTTVCSLICNHENHLHLLVLVIFIILDVSHISKAFLLFYLYILEESSRAAVRTAGRNGPLGPADSE